MMMDKNDGELGLNFGSSAENDELESVRQEVAAEVAASVEPAEAPAAESVTEAVPAEDVPVASPAPEAAPAPEPVLRSRIPVNRPAGTPPLASAPAPAPAPAAAFTGASYGAALRGIREAAQLDYKEVERGTQIAVRYLEAIESENLDALPPLVYVIAYIRTLCRFYRVEKTDADQLVAKLKEQLEHPCNQEIINSVEVDNSGNDENEKRLRKMMLLAGGAAVLLILVIALVLFFAFRKPSEQSAEPVPPPAVPTAGKSSFDSKNIEPLLAPATPKLVKLPVAE